MKHLINDKEVDIPSSWPEVTFRKFIALAKAGDDLNGKIAVFTGLEYSLVRKAKIKNLDTIVQALAFTNGGMNLSIPKSILGYRVPEKLEFETTGQFQDCDLIIKSAVEGKEIEKYPEIVGVYLMQNYLDSSDEEKQAFADKLWEAPCEEVVAIGNFTLSKFIVLRANTGRNFQRRNTPLRNFRLALIAWVKNGAFTLRYYLWKRKLHSTATNS